MTKSVKGTVDAIDCPSRLPALVASTGEHPRVHGYDLHRDLAHNYDFGEFIVTALTGVTPNEAWGKAVNKALVLLASTSVQHAPVHAATLSRRCGSDERAVMAAGLLGLVEEAWFQLSEYSEGETTNEVSATHDELFASLPDEVRGVLPKRSNGSVEQLAHEILTAAGLESKLQRMAAVCIARMPILAAEAHATPPGDIRNYPIKLPTYEYDASP